MSAALDAGIDGITLAAGLHLGSLALIEDHPRFRDAKLGIIVSSLRALQLFLKKNSRSIACPITWWWKARWPAATWASAWTGRLRPGTIVAEILQYLKDEQLAIPVIPAGGIFTGSDAVRFMEMARPASRWRRASPSPANAACRRDQAGVLQGQRGRYRGQPDLAQPAYPMRMIKSSPGIGDGIRPNWRPTATCSTPTQVRLHHAYNREVALHPEARRVSVMDQDLPVHAHAPTSRSGPVAS